jgi:hypothetical protein
MPDETQQPQQPQQPPAQPFNPTNAENPTGNTTNPATPYTADNPQQQGQDDYDPAKLERELRTEARTLAHELARGDHRNRDRYEQIKQRLAYLQEAQHHEAHAYTSPSAERARARELATPAAPDAPATPTGKGHHGHK